MKVNEFIAKWNVSDESLDLMKKDIIELLTDFYNECQEYDLYNYSLKYILKSYVNEFDKPKEQSNG